MKLVIILIAILALSLSCSRVNPITKLEGESPLKSQLITQEKIDMKYQELYVKYHKEEIDAKAFYELTHPMENNWKIVMDCGFIRKEYITKGIFKFDGKELYFVDSFTNAPKSEYIPSNCLLSTEVIE